MGSPTTPARRRPGGRSARVTRLVFDATVAILTEDGYDALSMETVAARAGVNKTTVYRRWQRKANLVADACLDAAGEAVPIPDTGNVRNDLHLLLQGLASFLSSERGEALARAVIGAAGHSPELRDAQRRFWEQRLTPAARIVDHAVARGELPATSDPELLVETAAAAVWMRSIASSRPVDAAFLAGVLDLVLVS